MAGNFEYTNFSQYYYDIGILLSTGSNDNEQEQWGKAVEQSEPRTRERLASSGCRIS